MQANVVFKDGHTENVIYSNYFEAFPTDIHNAEDLYFHTASGKYKFSQSQSPEECYIKRKQVCLPVNEGAFYKYYPDHDEWFVCESIDSIYFCSESE